MGTFSAPSPCYLHFFNQHYYFILIVPIVVPFITSTGPHPFELGYQYGNAKMIFLITKLFFDDKSIGSSSAPLPA